LVRLVEPVDLQKVFAAARATDVLDARKALGLNKLALQKCVTNLSLDDAAAHDPAD
jgi:hypothetical protein